MKRAPWFVSFLAALLLCGCGPQDSVNPWYLPGDVFFDPDLVGIWRAPDPETVKWTFKRRSPSEKSYTILYREKWETMKYGAVLFRIGDTTLLDLTPEEKTPSVKHSSEANQEATGMGHMLFKVIRVGKSLTLESFEADAVEEYLKDHPRALAHRSDGNGGISLTASTARLREFVRAHVDDEEYWLKFDEMKRSGLKPLPRWK